MLFLIKTQGILENIKKPVSGMFLPYLIDLVYTKFNLKFREFSNGQQNYS
jgi:hypothetical protein